MLLQIQLKKDFNVIPTKNRAQILNDALELAALDYLDYNIALNLTKYLINEDKYLPWTAALQSFRDIRLIIANTHYQEIFKVIIIIVKCFHSDVCVCPMCISKTKKFKLDCFYFL